MRAPKVVVLGSASEKETRTVVLGSASDNATDSASGKATGTASGQGTGIQHPIPLSPTSPAEEIASTSSSNADKTASGQVKKKFPEPEKAASEKGQEVKQEMMKKKRRKDDEYEELRADMQKLTQKLAELQAEKTSLSKNGL